MRERARLKLLGFLLAWAVVLAACASFAQPTVTRGGALKKRAYQTYSAMTLYVDPTGSDSNACTASGTSACLTLGGALNKVPIHIRHLVTINVASGTYAEVFRIQGFFIEGANGAASTAALTIAGTQTAYTVATGTNSGTVTSFADTSTIDGSHPVLTDSTQTWTTNNLRGRFLYITGGPGAGEYHLITSNTATTLSLAFSFTVNPTAASTYEIRTPGPVFTGTVGNIGGIVGRGTTTVSDISLQPSSGSGLTVGFMPRLIMNRMRVAGVTSGITTSSELIGPTLWAVNTTFVNAGTLNAFAIPATRITLSELFAFCSSGTTCSGSGVSIGARISTLLNAISGTIAGPFATAMIFADSASGSQSTGLWLDCSTGGIGVYSPPASADSGSYLGRGWATSRTYFSGCATGYSLNSPSTSYAKVNIFNNVTNAFVLTAGARMVIETPTFNTVTNELTVDGTVYTNANLTTFTRITGPQGSYAASP